MSAATCSSIGVGVSLLGMPPPLVGQLAGLHPHWWKPAVKGGQGVRRLVEGVMRLLRPTQTPSYSLCIAALLLISACPATPEEADQNLPEICQESEFPPSKLEPFEPCDNDAQCDHDICMNGYCSEPCLDATDCISFSFGGFDLEPPVCVFYGQDADGKDLYGCVVICDENTLDCPKVADACTYKAVDPDGERWDYVCSTENPCNESND